MKSVQLNESNTTLRLEGSETTRSMDIKNVAVKEWPDGGTIHLTVYDEKNIPIYTQALEVSQAKEGVITIDKRFVFYHHLSVSINAGKEGSRFMLEIHFE